MQLAEGVQDCSSLSYSEQRWELISLILVLRLRGEEPAQIEKFLGGLDSNLNSDGQKLLSVLKEAVSDSSLLWGSLKESPSLKLGAKEQCEMLESSILQLEERWRLNDKALEEALMHDHASDYSSHTSLHDHKRAKLDDTIYGQSGEDSLETNSKIVKSDHQNDSAQISSFQNIISNIPEEQHLHNELNVNIISTDDGCGFTTMGPLAIDLPDNNTMVVNEEKVENFNSRKHQEDAILAHLQDTKSQNSEVTPSSLAPEEPAHTETKLSDGAEGFEPSATNKQVSENGAEAELLRKMLMEKRAALKNFKTSTSNHDLIPQQKKVDVPPEDNAEIEPKSPAGIPVEDQPVQNKKKQKSLKQPDANVVPEQQDVSVAQTLPPTEPKPVEKFHPKHTSKHISDTKNKKHKFKPKRPEKFIQKTHNKPDGESLTSRNAELEDGEIQDSVNAAKVKVPAPQPVTKSATNEDLPATTPKTRDSGTNVADQGDKSPPKKPQEQSVTAKYYPSRAQGTGYHDFRYDKGYTSHNKYAHNSLQQMHMGQKRYHVRKGQQKFSDGSKQYGNLQQPQAPREYDIRTRHLQQPCVGNDGGMVNKEYPGIYGPYNQNMVYGDQRDQSYKYYIPQQDPQNVNMWKNNFSQGSVSNDMSVDPQTALKASLISILSKAQSNKPQHGSEDIYPPPVQMQSVQQNQYPWPRDWNQLAQSMRPMQQIHHHPGGYGQAMPSMQSPPMEYYQPSVVQNPVSNVSAHRQNIYNQGIPHPPHDSDYQNIGGQPSIPYGNEYHQ